jgi:hypothetical protein
MSRLHRAALTQCSAAFDLGFDLGGVHLQVPMIDGRPWYEVAMMKSHPFGDSEASPVSATKELLEEIGREILNLYVTRSQGVLPTIFLGSVP